MPPFDVRSRLADLELLLQQVDIAYAPATRALYALLTDAYNLVVEVGNDEHRLQQLTEAVRSRGVSNTQAKRARSVAAKVTLCLFRDERGDLVNKSTRSIYKRALERATVERLTPEEFFEAVQASGVFTFATKALLPSAECDDPIPAMRSLLRSTTDRRLAPIPLINDAPLLIRSSLSFTEWSWVSWSRVS